MASTAPSDGNISDVPPSGDWHPLESVDGVRRLSPAEASRVQGIEAGTFMDPTRPPTLPECQAETGSRWRRRHAKAYSVNKTRDETFPAATG